MDDFKLKLEKISIEFNSAGLELLMNEAEREGALVRLRQVSEKNLRIREEIEKTYERIENTQSEIVCFKKMLDGLVKTHFVNIGVHANMRILCRMEKEKLEAMEIKKTEIIKNHKIHYEKTRQDLILRNPIYEEIQTVKNQIKVKEIKKSVTEQKLSYKKRERKQLEEIHKKMFYTDIVKFAKDWLKIHKINKLKETFGECKKDEDEAHKKLIQNLRKKEKESKGSIDTPNNLLNSSQPMNTDEDLFALTNLVSFLDEVELSQPKVNNISGNIQVLDVNIIEAPPAKKMKLTPIASVATPSVSQKKKEEDTETISEGFKKFLDRQSTSTMKKMNSSINSIKKLSQLSNLNAPVTPRKATQEKIFENVRAQSQSHNEESKQVKKLTFATDISIKTITDENESNKEVVVEAPMNMVSSKYFANMSNAINDSNQFYETNELEESYNLSRFGDMQNSGEPTFNLDIDQGVTQNVVPPFGISEKKSTKSQLFGGKTSNKNDDKNTLSALFDDFSSKSTGNLGRKFTLFGRKY